ncbi:hypothetical protein V8F33_007453 [Rhypophila sp. PSN 637]
MGDSDSDESPSQPTRAQPRSFSRAELLDMERELGNVSRAADYPMARGQALAPERPRATTNPGGRAAAPRVVGPGMRFQSDFSWTPTNIRGPKERGRPRAATAAAPPPVAFSSRPPRSQHLQVPRPPGRHRPLPPPAGPPAPRQQARSSSRPYQPAMTPIQEARPAPRPSPLAQAPSAADGAPGPSRSQGAGVSAPTTAQSQGGYLAPPPLQHNWDPPNRRAASGARDPRAWRTGRSGRPLGQPLASRPRPPSANINPGTAYPATVSDQESERFSPRAYQEETEQAMTGRLNLGPGPIPDERERGRARERGDRSTFARGNPSSQGSLSDASQYEWPLRSTTTTAATSQNQQSIRNANPTSTSTTSSEELDTPVMSASAMPGWDTGYYSVEQAAVVLANTNRRTTVYINSGVVMPTQTSLPINAIAEAEESEDDFS